MPTPDIIKVFREKFGAEKAWIAPGKENIGTMRQIEFFLLQALTDREAEIVAGIEGMKVLYLTTDQIVTEEGGPNLAVVHDRALDLAIIKITKGEI